MASIPARTVAELIEDARQHPIRWRIPGVLMEQGVHILHGKEECYKTMLTLQMHEALAVGGEFLMRKVEGGLRTGIVELEEKPRMFGYRLANFFPCADAPPIDVFPEDLRAKVLGGLTPKQRIDPIQKWAETERLEVISIDSVIKLFPPRCDTNAPEHASEVFNQLQRLPTLWIIAHDRKAQPQPGASLWGIKGEARPARGNDEIVGSGRFVQDPDVVHQMVRPDARAPHAVFHWGKVREGEKDVPLNLWFDKRDFRLYPIHPFVHLLRQGPRTEPELLREAEHRYGWKERRARDYIGAVLKLKDPSGSPAVSESLDCHRKVLTLVGIPVTEDPADASIQVET